MKNYLNFKIILFLFGLINSFCLLSQPIPLKIEDRYVKLLTGQRFQIKSINLNDYMEHSFNPWGLYYGQNFQSVLSWLHTSSDYTRIKAMGFNCVRLNVCPSHFTVIPNMQRIKDHIEWARQNNLYIIIGYFAPPGSDSSGGYYDESDFWQPANEHLRSQFKSDWMQLMSMCKNMGYRHVIYNILNEPQIAFHDTTYPRIYLYRDILNYLLNYKKNTINDSNLVMIDGPNWASPDYRGFNYLNASLGTSYNNHIIYDFHYYMHDFVWRRSKWMPPTYPYHSTNGYSVNNTGYDTLIYNMNISGIDTVKIIQLHSFHQRGKYILKYFEIKNLQNNQIIHSLDMTGKVIQGTLPNEYILNNDKTFHLTHRGYYSSAQRGRIYMNTQNTAMVFSNTVRADTAIVGIGWTDAYAELKYDRDWPFDNNPIVVPIDTPIAVKVVIDGDSLHDNGTFQLSFKKFVNDPLITTNTKIISNFIYTNLYQHEDDFILSSQRDRVNAIFNIVNEMSVDFNKPFIIGEWAIPISQRVPENFTYFNDNWRNIHVTCDSMGWSYHAYREPHENEEFNTNNWITIGLFSGRNSTLASVNNIISGIQTGQTYFTLLTPDDPTKYYINKSLVDTLVRLMNGTFVVGVTPMNGIIPTSYSLSQNFPNPFNPNTSINFDIPQKEHVKLTIFDILGKELTVLINQEINTGSYKISWDASAYSSGIYFYKIETINYSETKKMTLLK